MFLERNHSSGNYKGLHHGNSSGLSPMFIVDTANDGIVHIGKKCKFCFPQFYHLYDRFFLGSMYYIIVKYGSW